MGAEMEQRVLQRSGHRRFGSGFVQSNYRHAKNPIFQKAEQIVNL